MNNKLLIVRDLEYNQYLTEKVNFHQTFIRFLCVSSRSYVSIKHKEVIDIASYTPENDKGQ